MLLARVPGGRPRTVDNPVSLIDLTPTILDIAGVRVRRGMEGRSLLPYLFPIPGKSAPNRQIFMLTDLRRANVRYRALGVVDWPYKLVLDQRTGIESMVNLEVDPEEQGSSLLGETKRREELRARLESWYGDR